jgi:hypothetical protein
VIREISPPKTSVYLVSPRLSSLAFLPSCSGGLQSIRPDDLVSHWFDTTAPAFTHAGPRGRVIRVMHLFKGCILLSCPCPHVRSFPWHIVHLGFHNPSCASGFRLELFSSRLATVWRLRAFLEFSGPPAILPMQRLMQIPLSCHLLNARLSCLATLRPRAFSAPRRFFPHWSFRPCFISVPPMGFHCPSKVSPHP